MIFSDLRTTKSFDETFLSNTWSVTSLVFMVAVNLFNKQYCKQRFIKSAVK